MKTILITLFFLSTIPALACDVIPGFDKLYKNKALTRVANQYVADLSESEIKIENYDFKMDWKFTDPAFECHDVNRLKMDVTLKYQNNFDQTQTCTATAHIQYDSEPMGKGLEPVISDSIHEISKDCKASQL